ncbi:MAG: indolepyruvate ferredoxin oxidoreductase family protein, partial [Candidatus Eremiobacteraeota bacterium]|nr:indolepyruvate ferredoxin oxidoreductase family protein [Candidatus Eremiobacteraeota bacterium]
HLPAQSEELAATALIGTQMLDAHPHDGIDGVIGVWYGKGPGIDRSGDALKHGNFAGTSRNGAVVILSGEDHEAKSSTLPFQQDFAFMSAGIPVLYPSSVREFLDFGLHAIALSRFSGCWVAMKLVGQLCDGGQTFDLAQATPQIVLPEIGFRKFTDFRFFPGLNVQTERHLYRERHAAVRAYARANGLDRIDVQTPNDRIGILSAGKSFADVRQALLDLGLDDAALRREGIRLGRLGVLYPADEEFLRAFARGLERIVVVEEKRAVVEAALKQALCNVERRVLVVGKEDERGNPFFPLEGGFDADAIAERLAPQLGLGAKRLADLEAIRARPDRALPKRTPNYCSGCPHNTSTLLAEGEIAWGSPGCHSFASIIEQPQRHIEAMTQLGGEGLPWIGLAPFTQRRHVVQNVGDGSLFHSSYLNIRFAAAAGANITFKVLYNHAVANTGAQAPVGGKSVPELSWLLAFEGVKRIAILTKTPGAYKRVALPEIVAVHSTDAVTSVLADFEKAGGVTVMIYDATCANELRRRRKRGSEAPATRFVAINEDVCENCGDCGARTNCMSLHKVETEFGPKTQIHQSSCNQDESCLHGDCPSFVTIRTAEGTGIRKPQRPHIDVEIPEPERSAALPSPYHIYAPGVGGTGVLTLNAILAQAAALDGKHVLSYDQTGAAQKWGPVVSSLIVADSEEAVAANEVGAGKAELYLALDLLAGAERQNLTRCDPARTVAAINTSLLPSGEMIRDVRFSVTPLVLAEAIAGCTRADGSLKLDANAIAEGALGDYLLTNVVMLGAAYQAGAIPLSRGSIETAIRLNGVAVDENLAAFALGRLAVHDPAALAAHVRPRTLLGDRMQGADAALSPRDAQAYLRLLRRCDELDEESRRLVAVRIADAILYQHAIHARRYVDAVLRVAERERAVFGPQSARLTRATIRGLHKLMTYKDEYEVARLHVHPAFQKRVRELVEQPLAIEYNLHPPVLRALGLRSKLRLGSWFTPFLRVLASMKSLRGTPLDPFGYAQVRRVERSLIGWYLALIDTVLANVNAENLETAVALLELPDEIRGYESIKLANVAAVKKRAEALTLKL